MIRELAKDRVKKIMERKGYKFFEKGNYNLNIIGVRSETKIANSFDDTLFCIFKKDSKLNNIELIKLNWSLRNYRN